MKLNNIHRIEMTGAILAGGKNTRFGGVDKAFVRINGSPLIEHTISLFQSLFQEVLVITNKPESYQQYDHIRLACDDFKEMGPLAGIHAAVKNANTPYVFVTSCDMPYLSEELIREEIMKFEKSKCDILLPRHVNGIEPLHAIYSRSIEKELFNFLQINKNPRIRDFFPHIKLEYWEITDEVKKASFKNMNSTGDIPDYTIA